MMKISKLSLAAAVSVALFSSAAMADSWDITQSVTLDTTTSVGQDGSTENSTQALNAINASGTTILDGSTQTATMNASTGLTLTQEGATTGSTQAINYTIASDLENDFTQSLPGDGAVSLSQQATGDSNVQGMNVVRSGAIVGTLTQSSLSTDVTMDQGTSVTTGTTATQVGNALIATGAVDTVDQDMGVTTGTVVLDQQITGIDALQAANLIDVSDAGASITTNATQNITTTGGGASGSFTLSQADTNFALQAGNAVINGGGNGIVAQAVNAQSLTQNQSSAVSSWQADNYVGPEITQ